MTTAHTPTTAAVSECTCRQPAKSAEDAARDLLETLMSDLRAAMAVALDRVAAAGVDSDHVVSLGRGTPDSPLFDIDVQLTGRDDNTFAIMSFICEAIRDHLGIRVRSGRAISEALCKTMRSCSSYDMVLAIAVRTVNAH